MRRGSPLNFCTPSSLYPSGATSALRCPVNTTATRWSGPLGRGGAQIPAVRDSLLLRMVAALRLCVTARRWIVIRVSKAWTDTGKGVDKNLFLAKNNHLRTEPNSHSKKEGSHWLPAVHRALRGFHFGRGSCRPKVCVNVSLFRHRAAVTLRHRRLATINYY